jgi:hypothetical protein
MEAENTTPATPTTPAIPSAKAWKPISEMSGAEKREYARLRAEVSRKKKKQAEELAEEVKRLEQDEMRQRYQPAKRDPQFDPIPQKWVDAFDTFIDGDGSLDKIEKELNRAWMYSHDVQTIRDLQRIIFGIVNRYVQTDEGYLRIMDRYPDCLMSDIVKSLQTRPGFNKESDAISLLKSETFVELYKDALYKSVSFLSEPKYVDLFDARMWSEVQREHKKVCEQEVEFVPTRN